LHGVEGTLGQQEAARTAAAAAMKASFMEWFGCWLGTNSHTGVSVLTSTLSEQADAARQKTVDNTRR
jgi:hypothetical protein